VKVLEMERVIFSWVEVLEMVKVILTALVAMISSSVVGSYSQEYHPEISLSLPATPPDWAVVSRSFPCSRFWVEPALHRLGLGGG
jgi:hypothetical protein